MFPGDGVTLNFLVEGEVGCFHCIEARMIQVDSDAPMIRPQY
jgi:hypothetical protein